MIEEQFHNKNAAGEAANDRQADKKYLHDKIKQLQSLPDEVVSALFTSKGSLSVEFKKRIKF